MTRMVNIGAAQLGPISATESRAEVVERLVALLQRGAADGCDLVVFPELALTTFFPRWYTDDISGHDPYFETSMPGPDTQVLFDEAKRLGVGFALGYAELTEPDDAGVVHRYNTTILVERDGSVVGRYRKSHIPGHASDEPWRPFQHLERRYFEESHDGFNVWGAFGGIVGMATCNDRRWPETYREMGLQGVEMILIGYNTPIHYAPDPGQNALQGFHNHLCMQAGAYQNGTWVVGVAKGGTEEGVESLAQSCIIAPSGQIVALAVTTGDELISASCDLDWCAKYKDTLFNFATYRRPELYQRIGSQKGVVVPDHVAAQLARHSNETEAN
jgi:N-carbamoyl-D-amino-acid hydrolase